MNAATHRHAVLWLVLATAWWGFSFPLTKALYAGQRALEPESGSWFLAALGHAGRCALAVLCLLPLVWRGEKWRATEWRQGLGLGLASSGGLLLQADGLDHSLASTSAFLTQFCCVLVPLWLAAVHRRALGWRAAGCVALVLLGSAVLAGFDPRTMRLGRGEAETLLATGFFTWQILLLDRAEYSGNRATVVTLVMFTVVAFVLGVVACFAAPAPSAMWTVWLRPGNAALLVAETLFCSLFAFLLMNHWQRHVTATEAGIIYCFEPVFASLCALILPGWLSAWMQTSYANESLTWRLVIGGGLILLANVALHLRPTAPRETRAAPETVV
jgi:drug/metabolite transporter (DMT)-like permease